MFANGIDFSFWASNMNLFYDSAKSFYELDILYDELN